MRNYLIITCGNQRIKRSLQLKNMHSLLVFRAGLFKAGFSVKLDFSSGSFKGKFSMILFVNNFDDWMLYIEKRK